MPPYLHLLNFLERLARSFRSITTVKQTRESAEHTNLVRQRAPRGHVFTATRVTPTCPSVKDHTLFGDMTPSKPNPFANALGRSKEHHYASTTSGKGTQRSIVSPDHAVYAENDMARCCIGQNTTQGFLPARPVRNPLGWVIGGSLTSPTATNTFHTSTTALQADLARFWEIDKGPSIKHISEADRRCEEHFQAHIRRTSEGRYIYHSKTNFSHSDPLKRWQLSDSPHSIADSSTTNASKQNTEWYYRSTWHWDTWRRSISTTPTTTDTIYGIMA